MKNLIEDLSTITFIARSNLLDLADRSISIISHDVAESAIDKKEITKIDIGIGELWIAKIEDEIVYKFVPCDKLEKAVTNAYLTKRSNLKVRIDNALNQRIKKSYKGLF